MRAGLNFSSRGRSLGPSTGGTWPGRGAMSTPARAREARPAYRTWGRPVISRLREINTTPTAARATAVGGGGAAPLLRRLLVQSQRFGEAQAIARAGGERDLGAPGGEHRAGARRSADERAFGRSLLAVRDGADQGSRPGPASNDGAA